jgi:uncharacterized protein DUF5683
MIDGSVPHAAPPAFAAALAGAALLRGRMGPGGLRGLQILRSGVHRVRGGFDSHAFPPFFRLVTGLAAALALAACAGVGGAQGAVGSRPALHAITDGAIHDSSGARGAARDSGGTRTGRGGAAAAKPSRFAQPRWVMLRSLVVPGWGQAYNGAWVKAGVVAAVEGVLIAKVVDDQGALNRLAGDVNRARALGDLELESTEVAAYNHRLESASTRQYLLGVTVLYALVDAYVDAHFKNFKIEFETDPALPGGTPPAGGARVGWEWNF